MVLTVLHCHTLLLDVCRRVVAETGVGFSFINIGGGLGINYREEDNEVALEAVAEAIRKVYTEEKLEKIGATPGVAPRLCMENGCVWRLFVFTHTRQTCASSR